MSLFDNNLASKPVKDPDLYNDEYSQWEYWFEPTTVSYDSNYEYGKPHTLFANDKKQKNFRKYASRSINWKTGRIR